MRPRNQPIPLITGMDVGEFTETLWSFAHNCQMNRFFVQKEANNVIGVDALSRFNSYQANIVTKPAAL
jgi:predicted glutamine amidotransferase